VSPRVIFPALAVMTLLGFAVGMAVGIGYVGTLVAVAGWAPFALVYRWRGVRRLRG
jgi:ABC-type sulfate transport system permease component